MQNDGSRRDEDNTQRKIFEKISKMKFRFRISQRRRLETRRGLLRKSHFSAAAGRQIKKSLCFSENKMRAHLQSLLPLSPIADPLTSCDEDASIAANAPQQSLAAMRACERRRKWLAQIFRNS